MTSVATTKAKRKGGLPNEEIVEDPEDEETVHYRPN